MCTLYERIIELCKTKGVSGSRMCLDLGLSKSTLSDIKSGRKKGISTSTAQKMASYLGVSVDYLISGQISEDETSFANGIHVFRSSLNDRLDAMVSELDKGSYYIAYSAPGIVVAVDNNTTLSNTEVENLVNIYRVSPEHKEKAPTVSGERKDVLDEVDVAFYGEYKELDEDQKATIRDMVAVMRSRKGKRP